MSDPEENKTDWLQRNLTLNVCYISRLSLQVLRQQQKIPLSGANQNSRLGTCKNTNLVLKNTE